MHLSSFEKYYSLRGKTRDLWYCSHAFVYIFVAFIVRYCSLANSGQLCYVGLHLVGLPTQCTIHLSLKTIILDHA